MTNISTECSKRLGLAVLSWKSPLTVKASLDTYVAEDLFSLFDDVVLCFQEIDSNDIELANRFGLRYVGNEHNTGIQGGFRLAYESLDTEYVIILENDLHLTASLDSARRQLTDCLQMLENGTIHMARMRSRFNPGYPIRAASMYSKYFPIRQVHPEWNHTEELDRSPNWRKWLRRTLRPGKAKKWSGRSVYIEKHPDALFPDRIKTLGDYLIVDSSVMPWTNQPTLISRQLLGELLDYADRHPSSRTVNGFQDFEKPLNNTEWASRYYRIAITPGIFTHNRLDR